MASRALTPTEQSWLDLARRVARPAGPRVDDVRAALADYASGPLDPAEAWEALVARGLAAPEWATRGPADVRALSPSGGARPCTVESIVAVAGDPEGVATAEALADEVSRRLEPWNELRPRAVVWRTVPRDAARFPTPNTFAATPAFEAIQALYDTSAWGSKEDGALRRSVERAFRPISGRPSGTVTTAAPPTLPGDPAWWPRFWDRNGPGQQAIYHVLNRAMWEECVARDLTVPRSFGDERRRFSELMDPAEPLLDLWRLGYVVGDLDDLAVTLFAPER